MRAIRLKGGKLSITDQYNDASGAWLDYNNPSKEELSELSKKTGVTLHDLRIALDSLKRPRIIPRDKYSIITFKYAHWDGHEIKTPTFGIIIGTDFLITTHREHIKAIDEFNLLNHEQQVELFKQGLDYIVFEILSNIFTESFFMLEGIEEEMDHLENQVIRNPKEIVIHRIFKLKKALIFFHKAMSANKEVTALIEKRYVKQIRKQNIDHFAELYYDSTELIDIEGTYREILTGSLDMYLSSVSNNLNEVMKKLTVYASYILVPTFIAAVYGMNFKYMPELSWKVGYAFSIMLMVASISFMYFLFKRKGWM
jgi:magnesium transporter